MYLVEKIMMFTIERLQNLIDNCDAIILGAGAGLSTAAGFEYGGKLFLDNFPDMYKKFGVTDMYSAGFSKFSSSEEKWGYWCRSIYLNRYKNGAKKLYVILVNILKKKEYFVITTNVDHQFQLAGIDKERLFYTQGDYGLFQCSKPCHKKTYDNGKIVMNMLENLNEGLIPTSLIPHCPVCGREMEMNLRSDDTFVEDEGWINANNRYREFILANKDKKILFLELGVGFNTPVIIKYPFIQMTNTLKDAFYVCINKGYNYIPEEIKDKSMLVEDDLAEVINLLN